MNYKPVMKKKIIRCSWKKYENFRSFCCVLTIPHPSGTCYLIPPDVAFIGYNYPWKNNGMRTRIWPEHTIMKKAIDLTWLNASVRTLSRVMVKPEFRHRGVAEYLIRNTIDTVGVRFIECVTFTNTIARILERVGFVNHGRLSSGVCDYYLYEVVRPVCFCG
jgi:GNAT superfamily N-acetyltransferase